MWRAKLMDKSLMNRYIESGGLPAFPLDNDGFPYPGTVVKYFREHRLYNDPLTGKQKSWTQQDLAERLGVSAVMIRYLENHHKGFDSMDRRKTLALLLNIPPLLLGLTSDEQVQALLTATPTHLRHTTGLQTSEEIHMFSDALTVYKASYDQGSIQQYLFAIEK